ncbi:MAG: acetyl-CoA C-acetyltransferase [Gemmatimonadetes bacterium]|nr:acetyl-CoA C-acetyltransferase [Gemmatimonadota bacterium]
MDSAAGLKRNGSRGLAATRDIVLVGGCRTAFGSFGGSLKDFTATDLGVFAATAAIERSRFAPDEVEHVIFGNALQTSNDAIYLARHVGLRSGVPQTSPAVTVNRLCGSGFESIIQAARLILTGEAEVVLAGGAESMSQAPHVIHGARWGIPLGKAPMSDLLWAALFDPYAGFSMAETAENLAEQYGLSRQEVDAFALNSQERARDAIRAGRLEEEIVPIELKERKGTRVFDADEHPRPETTLEILGKLSPYFKKDGVVTAGNASGIVDGASAVIVTTRERAERAGGDIQGALVGWGIAGVEPRIMGIGPAPASRKALEAVGIDLAAVDLVEVNEAFAPQTVAVMKELSLAPEKLNVNGGAIALGHPLAASGTRLTITLLNELRRRGGGTGLASACIGGGQGAAVVVRTEPNGAGGASTLTGGS